MIYDLKKQISEIEAKITLIQNQCSHPAAATTQKNDSSTGNYDRNDSYWTNHHCTLCDKRWRTDQ